MTWPGTAVVAFAVLTIDSAGVSTSVTGVHAGSLPPAGQLFPGAADTAVAVSTWSPVSGSLTVTVEVIVTVCPTAISPVHTAPVAPIDRVPEDWRSHPRCRSRHQRSRSSPWLR